MVAISALTDDFDDNAVDPARWPQSYNLYDEVGGRARVVCNTGYNAYASDFVYTLAGSQLHVRIHPPAAGGGGDVWAQMLITSSTAGTDACITVASAPTAEIRFESRSGYVDGAAVAIPYDEDLHAYVRIRETGGTLWFETSPDSTSWTARKSVTSPAWTAAADLLVQLLAHRNAGTDDFAEFDNFNVTAPTVVDGEAAAAVPSWQILTGPASGGYAQAVTTARNRKLTMRLTSPSDFSFEMSARHGEAYNIHELSTDVHVRWTSAAGVRWILFRGRVGSSSDAGGADEHRASFTALDYRGVLARRRLWHGTSLNPNDSFEDGVGFWSGTGGTFEAADDQRQDRTKSGKITPTGAAATVKIASSNFTAAAGNTYRLSGWLRNAVARSVTLQIDWKDAGGTTLSSSSLTKTLDAETWTHFNFDATAPGSTTQASVVGLMTGTPPATDIMWMDDARATIAPNHASLLTYDATDQASIAWALINDTQRRTNGNLGISNGSSPTGVLRDRTYQVGDAVADRIQELSETLDGFDWDIVPDSPSTLLLRIWSPERGVGRGVVLMPGGLISTWRRESQPSAYGNALRMTGADTTTPKELEAPDLASHAEGRWDVVLGDSGLTTQPALNERADWQLTDSQVVRPTYSVVLTRGQWMGPDHIWLGDPVRLVIFSGRLTVNTVLRVYEIAFTLDEDGGEQIELVLGGPRPLDIRRWPAHQDRRISTLERR